MTLSSRDLRFRVKLALAQARLRAYRAIGRGPVVTYATYRTSSSAIHWAIRRAVGGRAIKAHALLPQRLTMAEAVGQQPVGVTAVPANRHVGDWAVSREVVVPRRAADFVIVVRDPLAVAVSSFSVGTEWLPPELAAREWPQDGACDGATLEALAAAMFEGRFNWRLMPRWFEGDVRPALGWDALATPFPQQAGVLRTEHGPWRILLLRADVADDAKSQALGSFIGAPGIAIRRENSGDERGRSGIAAAVRRALARRPLAVQQLLDDRFTRHFWSPAQIEAMRRRWLPGDAS